MSSKITTGSSNSSISVSGTAQSISATSIEVWSVTLCALETNESTLYIGGEDVDDTNKVGIPLSPGQMVTVCGIDLGAGTEPFNLNELYMVGTQDDELSFTYFKSDRTPRTRS